MNEFTRKQLMYSQSQGNYGELENECLVNLITPHFSKQADCNSCQEGFITKP